MVSYSSYLEPMLSGVELFIILIKIDTTGTTGKAGRKSPAFPV